MTERELSEEERRSLGCQCTRLDDVWHHGRHCPVPAVERILAARTAQPEEDVKAAYLLGYEAGRKGQPESTEGAPTINAVDGHTHPCPTPGYAGQHTAVGAGALSSPYRCHGCGTWFTLGEPVEGTTGGDDRG